MAQMVARVVLRGARTYNVGKRRWIKDVPGVVKGEDEVLKYEQNGFFHTTIIKRGNEKKAKDESPAAESKPKAKEKEGSPKKGKKPLLRK